MLFLPRHGFLFGDRELTGFNSFDFKHLISVINEGEIFYRYVSELDEIISSIPSPFAYIWFYGLILRDYLTYKANYAKPFIEKYKMAWTILALRKLIIIDNYLEIRFINISESNEPFIQILKRIIDRIEKKAEWLNWYVLAIKTNSYRYRGIISTSPLTLIVPSRNLPNFIEKLGIGNLEKIYRNLINKHKCEMIAYLCEIISNFESFKYSHLSNFLNSEEYVIKFLEIWLDDLLGNSYRCSDCENVNIFIDRSNILHTYVEYLDIHLNNVLDE